MDADQLPLYLNEFMWKEGHGTTAGEAFNNILDHIADIYTVDEQADIGADHSRGNHSIQDVSIRGSSSVVQNLRKERDFI